MRWTHLAALLITTGLILTSPAASCLAEMPDFGANRQQVLPGRVFAGQNWWTRYGEPVNTTIQAETSLPNKGLAGPIPVYGDGYIYGPDTCDCSPPCIWHLWSGYYQNPKRCKEHHLLNRGCNACGHGCGFGKVFGNGCCNAGSNACGCAAATSNCAAPVSCGCAAPAAPAMPSEKQASIRPPVPLPDEALLYPVPRLK